MFRHRSLLGIVIVSGMSVFLGFSALRAAENSAQELYKAGMQKYQQGDYDGAMEILRRVDPMQLGSKQERVTLFQVIQGDADRRASQQAVVGKASPTQLLQQAADAKASGSWSKAATIYRLVLEHPQASDQDKKAAHTSLVEVQQKIKLSQATAGQAPAVVTAQPTESKGVQVQAEGKTIVVATPAAGDSAVQSPAVAKAVETPSASVAEKAAEKEIEKPVATAVEKPVSETVVASPAASAKPVNKELIAQAKSLFAQQKLAEGKDAQAKGNWRLALNAYQDGLDADPENKELIAAVAGAKAGLAKADTTKDLMDTHVASQKLQADAVVAEFKASLAKADDFLAANNFAGASEAVQAAKLGLDRRQGVLSASVYDGLRKQAVDKAAAVSLAQKNFESQQLKAAAEQNAREQADARTRVLRERDEEIQKLLNRAAELRREQKYDKAIEYLNQALFLDPNNAAAQAMKEMIQDTMTYVRAREAERLRAKKIAIQSTDNLEATVPYNELLTYPSDWPELTYRRLRGLNQDRTEADAKNRRVQQQLKQPIQRIEFENNRLANVIDFLRSNTGLNFFVNWPALQQVGVDQDKPISLQLTEVPAEQALRLVLQQASVDETNPVTFGVVEGIITISTQRDLTRTTEIRTYDIRDLLLHVPNFTKAPTFDLDQALESRTIGGGGGGSSGGSPFKTEEGEEEGPTPAELVAQITTLIQDTVGSPTDWAERGGTISSLRELNGNLIVKTTPENHVKLSQLLAQLRETRAMQISVEARFLLVDQNYLNEFGIDLDLTYTPTSGNWGPISIDQGSINLADRQSTGGSGSFGTTTERGLSLGVSYLDDIEVNLLLRATQAKRNSITLTAPRLTFFNGQTAYVFVARQLAFVSDLEPVADAAGFDVTLSTVSSGVMLKVTGTISADRRYVTMTVEPNLSTVKEPVRQIEVIGVLNGNNNAAPVLIRGFIEAPTTDATQIKTTVSVPDRGTLLLGGQRLVGELEVEAGVPVLSKIPLVNRLFTNTSTVKDERTLLVLIKPTIILQGEEEENLFPGLLQDPAKYNVGRGGGSVGSPISGKAGGS